MSGPTIIPQPFRPGSWVRAMKGAWQVVACLENQVVHLSKPGVKDITIPVSAIEPDPRIGHACNKLRLLEYYPIERQNIALQRQEWIRECLENGWSKKGVEDLAGRLEKSVRTTLRLVDLYLYSGERVEALIPNAFKYGLAHNNLDHRVKAIIQEAVKLLWLTAERPQEISVLEMIAMKCRAVGLDPPARATVRRVLDQIPGWYSTTVRHGKKAARDTYRQLSGKAPTGRHPFGKIEIDHTPLNILLRLASGEPVRPWLTLAIDLYTRMIVGMHIGLEGPSRLAVGICLYRTMTDKTFWLRKHGIITNWPCVGIPEVIQTDSGKDFLSLDLERIALAHNIKLQKRPRGQADFGGFIERAMGKAALAVDILPGKTFRSIVQKEDYNPKKWAVFTLDEIEKYLLHYFVEEYHHCPHRGLRGRSPAGVWDTWHRAHKDESGSYQTTRQAPNDLLMSFLPSFERTIQRGGVSHEGIEYNDPCLDLWTKRPDPNSQNGKHRFHRDTRFANAIFWKDPESGCWYRILSKDRGLPEAPEWEIQDLLRSDAAIAKASRDYQTVDKGRRARYKILEEGRARSAAQHKKTNSPKKKTSSSKHVSENPIRRIATEGNFGTGLPDEGKPRIDVDQDWGDLPRLSGGYLDL